ncbi:MAG: adenine phosphoribosyltransferase [Verrucomicrobiaceae bacterium]|nr:adenine phosphoribosyltransferase [Verrucomicrobiaceae bacterium]
MRKEELQRLSAAIRDVPDFPKPGILFKDITPVLGDGELFEAAVRGLAETAQGTSIDKVVGIDARGFIFGAAVSMILGAGFVPIRKKGKLPWATEIESYSLEYGEAEIEIHKDAIMKDEKVLVIDDLLATGGTAQAALKLIKSIGGQVVAVSFFIELTSLGGRERLTGSRVEAILTY